MDPNKEIAAHGSVKGLARVERLAASKTTLQSNEKETTKGTLLQEQVKITPDAIYWINLKRAQEKGF